MNTGVIFRSFIRNINVGQQLRDIQYLISFTLQIKFCNFRGFHPNGFTVFAILELLKAPLEILLIRSNFCALL